MSTNPLAFNPRRLILVLGDQLNRDSAVFDDSDKGRDAVLMLEVTEEAVYVPQHKLRLTLFFSAMRHFRDRLRDDGWEVCYSHLDERNNRGNLASELSRWLNKTRPGSLLVCRPGDYRVLGMIEQVVQVVGCQLDLREDCHFYSDPQEFADYADGRENLRLEHFYRWMRRRHDVLIEDGKPVGGDWNYDADNRKSFGKDGPGKIKAPRAFRPDYLTRDVMAMVEKRFPNHPGETDDFDYPVTPTQAQTALRDFVKHRLARFGDYQDAMAAGRPYLFHSRLSAVLNLHLLDPRTVVDAVVAAYESGDAPLNAVEGLVRQILGWREFVRGIYWWKMPDYAEMNALDADQGMPALMWNGETEMCCVRDSVRQLNRHAYAHHIQRLMVLGQFALLLGVRPDAVNRWHLAMYIDAVDWVSVPNVLGMSQYADGGVMASKPYAASGAYIDRMSDYCADCRYEPRSATSASACPFTVLYWDFLSRNRQRIGRNQRLGLQYRNLDRKSDEERRQIRQRARAIRAAAANADPL